MINRVVLVGRLTRDPEFRQGTTGTPICSFTVAVDRLRKTPGQPDADFIPVVCFGRTAENVNTYLRKGALVGVDGRIQTRSYDNQQGQRVYRTEVIADTVQFLESRSARAAQVGYSNQGSYNQGNYGQSSYQSNNGYNSQPADGGYQSYGNPQPRNTYKPQPQPSAPANAGGSNPYESSVSQDYSSGFNADDIDISDDDLPF